VEPLVPQAVAVVEILIVVEVGKFIKTVVVTVPRDAPKTVTVPMVNNVLMVLVREQLLPVVIPVVVVVPSVTADTLNIVMVLVGGKMLVKIINVTLLPQHLLFNKIYVKAWLIAVVLPGVEEGSTAPVAVKPVAR